LGERFLCRELIDAGVDGEPFLAEVVFVWAWPLAFTEKAGVALPLQVVLKREGKNELAGRLGLLRAEWIRAVLRGVRKKESRK
jgi:hypothetical protein